MPTVIRDVYLETFSLMRDKNLIKVATGPARAGKSTVLGQYAEWLSANEPGASVISINFDIPMYRFLAGQGWQVIFDAIVQALNPVRMNYVFLDEIQNVPHCEKLLLGLFVHPMVDLYVTGSTACLQSAGFTSLPAGRVMINVLPFSFAEYLQFTGNSQTPHEALDAYLMTGGIPEAVRLSAVSVNYAFRYLQNIYRGAYERDIKPRHKIYSDDSYRNVVTFLADTMGSPVSSANISKALTNAGQKIDNKSAAKYISALVGSHLFYRVNRYDIPSGQPLATKERYYAADTGLRNSFLNRDFSGDRGRLLENAVFLELLRRGNQVQTGKAGSMEINFVARDTAGRTTYIQVAPSARDGAALARKLAPFGKIHDNNEKILITADRENGLRNGIRQIGIVDWLLMRETAATAGTCVSSP